MGLLQALVQGKKYEETYTPKKVKQVLQTSQQITQVPTSSSQTDTKNKDGGPRRLHVTNLPFKVRDNELRLMFEVIQQR